MSPTHCRHCGDRIEYREIKRPSVSTWEWIHTRGGLMSCRENAEAVGVRVDGGLHTVAQP